MAYIKATNENEQEMYDFLEDLRQSGHTNMFGAGIYLQHEFGITPDKARVILNDWMDAHGDPTRKLDAPLTDIKAGQMVTAYHRAKR